MTCIRKEHIQELKKDLKEKGFSLGRLHKYLPNTQERLAYLDQFFNNRKESEFFNNKYETYILKNQKSNLKEWAKKATKQGLKADSTKTLIEKIDSLKKVLKPSDKEILNGLVKQKLGFTVTQEYAKGIYDTYNTYKNNFAAVMKNRPDYMKMDGDAANKLLEQQIKAGEGDVYELGKSLVALKQAYQDAKLAADKKEKTATNWGKTKNAIETFAGTLKSLKATLDLSSLRQLSAAIATGGDITKSALKGYKFGLQMAKVALKDPKFAQQLTDMYILTRPNSLNGMYRKLGIDVGLKEEAFPETFVGRAMEKTRVFPASEVAFTGAIQMARAGIADTMIEQYNGDIGAMKDDGVGDYVNQITGRGKVHIKWNGDDQSLINVFLFAPKWLAARIRTITDLQYVVTGKTQVEKMKAKTALRNAMFYIALPMLLKAINRAFDEDDPHGEDAWERFLSAFDPRSTEFGKFRIGDTRIDASFGLASLYTLVGRGITRQTITTKGQTKDTEWGDLLANFLEGKMSPALHTVENLRSITFGSGKDFMGRPITLADIVLDAVSPISAQQLIEAYQNKDNLESPTAAVAGMVLDFFGIAANTYEPSEKDLGKSKEFKHEEERLAWNIDRQPSDIRPAKNSKIMTDLQGKEQERAVADFKKLYNERVTDLIKSREYKDMPDDAKKDALTRTRKEVTNTIKGKYGLK